MILFSVHETAKSGMSKTLKQDATAARRRNLAVAPTNTKTRMTKGHPKEYPVRDEYLQWQTFEGFSWWHELQTGWCIQKQTCE